jgi:ATP-dependent helicase/nuclease subunit A
LSLARDSSLQATLFEFPANETEPAQAPQALTVPPDQAARQQALDVHRSFIVEAPAGSGKTGLLVQRFLKLLADESVTEPEQVLALTFTIKATAEMRDRVIGHLESAHRASDLATASDFERETRILALAVLERSQRFGWSLLDQPQRLHIRTIDSVCAEIARTLPVLSGSGGNLSPAADARPLYREAARRTLLLLGTPNSDPSLDAAISDLLLHRDGNLADCETLLADMLGLRDQWGKLIPLTDPQLDDAWLDANVLPQFQRALEQAICAGLTRVSRMFPPGLLAELADVASDLGYAAAYKSPEPSRIAPCAGIRTAPGAEAADLAHWTSLIYLLITKGGELRKERGLTSSNLKFEYDRKGFHHSRLSVVLDALRDHDDLLPVLESVIALPPAEYPADQWAVAKSLFRVLSRALVQLQFVFAERAQCDFTEFTLLARTALIADTGPEDLASALGARLQHLLVDEMQDTSASQYELLRLLTASWDGHSQTVFLVGDPRQSIYLFRQARVEGFVQTLETCRLGELPLTRLRLTANFRSQRTLVTHFNRDFSLVFPRDTDSLPYADADGFLPPSSHASGLIWHANPVEIRPAPLLPAEIVRTPAQLRHRQARQDALEMRHIVELWFNKPLPPGCTKPWKIAVLVRNRNHLAEVVANFDDPRHGRIPYRAVEITALADRQEILDLTALTRTLLHPADRVAGLAILRAPWCGLSLADLHTLTGADDPSLRHTSIRRLMQDRGDLLPEASIERLKNVWSVLESAAAQSSRVPTSRLVERVWRSLGGDAYLNQPELSNTRRFLSLLDEMEADANLSGTTIDPTRLVDRLKGLYAEPALVPPGQPSVELLTIHRAKGLEWDVVLVPALERSQAISQGRLLTWSELETYGPSGDAADAPILVAPIAAKGEDIDPLTTWLKEIHKKREAAERKRLFYVAATRAREELHLFAAPDLTTQGVLSHRWDSLLKSALPAAQPALDEALQARSGVASFRVPKAGAAAVITMHPEPDAPQAEPILLDLAAAAAPVLRPPLQRLPAGFDPRSRLLTGAARLPYGASDPTAGPPTTKFHRPEGSFAARSFGNAVHASLDVLARRIAEGQTPAELLAELPAWTSRVAALLRADGLPRATVDRLARETRTALENVLRDPNGLWLLAPHAGAANEFALTAWAQDAQDSEASSIRVDRIFHAGSEPHAEDENTLWIIDYKTSTHSAAGVEAFLASQRAAYAPQLETYARVLAAARHLSLDEVRLGLYFPALPRLLWWKAGQP